jgi:glucosyltransferase
MKLLSIIVPCYNEEASVGLFYNEIVKYAEILADRVEMELIYVDDGSSDRTIDAVKRLAEQDQRVRYISFSRNFGKESAMFAGLQKSRGDYVAVMDCDLQDPPELLPEMLDGIEKEGWDCVATRRVSRKGEPVIRSFFARRFYSVINRISKTEIVDGARDYRLMTRQMVDAIVSMSEYNRFSKGIFSWVGFKTKWLEYENVERAAGETKWSFWKLFKYSVDGIVAFSTAPLSLASFIGILCCAVAFIWILIIVIKTLVWGDPVAGFPTLACLVLMIGGIQLFSVGVLGQYLAKTYLETKKRPIYIIKEDNLDEK